MSLSFHFLTLFPEVFPPVLGSSLFGKAQASGALTCTFTQIRDFATDKHKTVDEPPYGGGDGMLLKVDVLYRAWMSAIGGAKGGDFSSSKSGHPKTRTILLSPQGALFTSGRAKELASGFEKIIFVCGHYEGVDERFIELCVDEELSIGNYVLTGGELPAMVMADAIARWVPGVIGSAGSVSGDSLEGGLLKYPQYTRPAEFQGLKVPEVLTSGNHGAVDRWRREQSIARTKKKRPDLG
jgi:tRNA (guanine37-N1)-methyltransferase